MKKKNLIRVAALATVLVGCAKPTDVFIIEGQVTGMDGQYVYLSYASDTLPVIDSAKVENGAFKFTGKLEAPASQARLYVNTTFKMYDPTKLYSFYMEPKSMELNLDAADFSKSVLKGSFTQEQVDSLETQQKMILDEAKSIRDAMEAEKDHEKAAELREQLEPYFERVQKLCRAFIESHPNSYATPAYLMAEAGRLEYAELKRLYDSMSDKVKEMPEAKEIAKELAVLERVQPGQLAPDFEAKDVNGKMLKLSDFKGKYVILDFWASWCVPCRKGNPHMKELYKKYNSKGLEFIYVADNDSQPDNWRKAIKEDGLENFHHVLRGMKVIEGKTLVFDRTNDISDKYAIHFLPTKYLIDDEGKIVGKLDGEELDAKLKEIFGN